MRRRLIFLALLPLARPHGVLTIPAPRPLPTPQGVKLEPFSSARDAATRGCGLREGIPGTVVQPTQAFTVGRTVQVQWDLTIPHPADVQDTGIRIAIHYDDQDSFGCNILAGGLDGDPNFDPYTKATHLSAGPVDAPANTLVSTIVTLPNKTCDYCVLQWVWAARTDGPNGGYYISCADIAITANGLLDPTRYLSLPSEAGNELPINQPSSSPGGYVCRTPYSIGGGAAAGVGVVVVIALVIACGVGAYCKFGKGGGGGGGSSSSPKYGGSPPPPPGAAAAAPQLPPGWTSAVDPSSGTTYYVGPGGQTSWTPPVAQAASPPPPPPPGPGGLPPGWTSAVDPASGQTYYVNSASGQTSWSHPNSRV